MLDCAILSMLAGRQEVFHLLSIDDKESNEKKPKYLGSIDINTCTDYVVRNLAKWTRNDIK